MRPITTQKTVEHLPSQTGRGWQGDSIKVGNQWIQLEGANNEPTTKGIIKTIIGAVVLVVLGYSCSVLFLAFQ